VLTILNADLDDARIADLLSTHARLALGAARCRVGHALDVDALRSLDIEVWAIWLNDGPVGVGALRRLSPSDGELKSMYVVDAARGRGIGARLLAHLIESARRQGLQRLFLETGASDYFAAARSLYASAGFSPCDAFADMPPHPDSCFMSRPI